MLLRVMIVSPLVNIMQCVVDVELARRGNQFRSLDDSLEFTRLVVDNNDGRFLFLAAPDREPDLVARHVVFRLYDTFWDATHVSLRRGEGEPDERSFPHQCNGYEYEAQEVHRCLRAGLLESEHMPHSTTLEIMRTLDAIREEWGLRYPME